MSKIMPILKHEGFRQKAKKVWRLLRDTGIAFDDDNSIKLAASLSYFTIFSLPPLIIVIVSLCGIFFGKEAVQGEIFGQINGFVGNQAAKQIQEMIAHLKLNNDNFFTAGFGVVTLLIGASGVFGEIQSSINYIWGLKAKPKRGLIKFLKNRLMSFAMIGSLGFLFLVSLIINAIMDILGNKLHKIFIDVAVDILYVVNTLLVFSIITALFCIIFRTLPDGKISLKDTLTGSAVTAFLFMIGKFAIGYYLSHSRVGTTYGAAASILLVLVWVYYSAIILYFGAEFTKIYTKSHHRRIIPNQYSVLLHKEISEVEPKVVSNDE